MWKKLLIRLAFDLVAALVIAKAKEARKPWAVDLEIFLLSIKNKI